MAGTGHPVTPEQPVVAPIAVVGGASPLQPLQPGNIDIAPGSPAPGLPADAPAASTNKKEARRGASQKEASRESLLKKARNSYERKSEEARGRATTAVFDDKSRSLFRKMEKAAVSYAVYTGQPVVCLAGHHHGKQVRSAAVAPREDRELQWTNSAPVLKELMERVTTHGLQHQENNVENSAAAANCVRSRRTFSVARSGTVP